MKRLRTILLAAGLCGLLLALSAAGALFYVHRRPDAFKALLESALSSRLGAEVTIAALACDWRPLRLEAHGIAIGAQATAGIWGEFSRLSADGYLEGPFGRRTLVVERLDLGAGRIRLPLDSGHLLPGAESGGPSWLSRLSGPLAGFFLFRGVRLESARAAGGEIEIPGPDWRLAVEVREARLTSGSELEVSAGGRFEMPARDIAAEAPDIRITAAGAPAAGNGPCAAEVILRGGSVRHAAGEERDISLQASGRVHPRGQTAALPRWQVRIADWLDITGALEYEGGPGQRLEVDIERGLILAEPLLAAWARLSGVAPGIAALDGPLQVVGRLRGARREGAWAWDLGGEVRLAGNRLSLDAAGTRLRGRLDGTLGVSGALQEPGVALDLKMSAGDLSRPGVRLQPFAADLALEGTYPLFHLKALDIRIPRLPAALSPGGLALEDLRLQLRDGRVNAAEGTFAFAGGIWTSSSLGPLSVSLSGDGTTQKLSVEGRDAGLLAFLPASGLLPPGWRVQGRERLEASAVLTGGRGRFDALLTLDRASFGSPGGALLGENIGLRASLEGDLDPTGPRLRLKADARAAAGEALCGRFYLDFGRQPVALSARAEVNPGARRWQLEGLSLGIEGLLGLKIEGRGGWEPGGGQAALDLSLPETEIAPLFRQLVSEPFAMQAPFLETLEVGGRLSAGLGLQSDLRGWRAEGRLRWTDGRLSSADPKIGLEGVSLDLPVWCQSFAEGAGARALEGRLKIAGVDLPGVGRQAVDWPLRAGPNRLEIEAATMVEFGGGTVSLGPIRLTDIARPGRLLRSEISVTSVDSGRFLRGIWPDAALGPVNGRLALACRGDRWDGRGRLTADVFGGRVSVLDPSLSAPFSAAPVLALDVLLEDLRLKDLTAGTAFGRIDGLLQGSIKGLEIVVGQPQRFELLLETRKKAGVPQQISVQAVNAISQIGGGETPFLGLAGGALKLLPGFGYRQIGIRSFLHNDVFTVNGTIREGGTEYLVRRDGLAGVDVVNRDPDNRIRFKDMVQRIGRALGTGGRPVVDVQP